MNANLDIKAEDMNDTKCLIYKLDNCIKMCSNSSCLSQQLGQWTEKEMSSIRITLDTSLEDKNY